MQDKKLFIDTKKKEMPLQSMLLCLPLFAGKRMNLALLLAKQFDNWILFIILVLNI